MILYSFRRCPWAMRARLALRYAQCPVEIREVSLKAKPAELLALSPKGTVPVLSADDLVLEESLDIMRWALAESWLVELDARLAQQAYLFADHPSLADAALLPLMRQFAGVEPEWFAHAPYPHLRAWLQRWLESALFKAIMAR